MECYRIDLKQELRLVTPAESGDRCVTSAVSERRCKTLITWPTKRVDSDSLLFSTLRTFVLTTTLQQQQQLLQFKPHETILVVLSLRKGKKDQPQLAPPTIMAKKKKTSRPSSLKKALSQSKNITHNSKESSNIASRYTDEIESKEEDHSASSSSEGDDEIRLKAFSLLTKIGPDKDDDPSQWPEKPTPRNSQVYSTYQSGASSAALQSRHLEHQPAAAVVVNPRQNNGYYEELGMAGLLVSCIADACVKSTEFVAKTGYESIYGAPPTTHSFYTPTNTPTTSTSTATSSYNSSASEHVPRFARPSSYRDDANGDFEKVSILNTYRGSSTINKGQTSGES